jgi:hypothetical protein
MAPGILGGEKFFFFYAVFLTVDTALADEKPSNIRSVSHHRLILYIE